MAGMTGLAVGALGLGSAYVQKEAAEDAAAAQQQASMRQEERQEEALRAFEERTQPFATVGEKAISPLLQQLGIGPNAATVAPDTRAQGLLGTISDDITERLLARRAAAGKLGTGGTALELQRSLAPLELEEIRRQQAIEQSQQQMNIQNLFNLLRVGANTATGVGQAGLQTAAGVSEAMRQAGLAQAQGELGKAEAIQGLLGQGSQMLGYAAGMPTGAPTGLGGGIMSPSSLGQTPFIA